MIFGHTRGRLAVDADRFRFCCSRHHLVLKPVRRVPVRLDVAKLEGLKATNIAGEQEVNTLVQSTVLGNEKTTPSSQSCESRIDDVVVVRLEQFRIATEGPDAFLGWWYGLRELGDTDQQREGPSCKILFGLGLS